MITESFAIGHSFIHRLDPRIKILSGFILSLLVAIIQQFDALIFALILSTLLILFTRLSIIDIVKRLLIVNSFIAMLWVIMPFSYPGNSIFQFAGLEYTQEGVLYVSRMTLKSNVLILIFIGFFSTNNIATLGHALQQLKIPSKLITLLLFTYRYINVMSQEYQRLLKAAKVRCFKPQTNFHTYKTYAYFVGMLIVNATTRGEKIHQAMKCRCFDGEYHSISVFKTGVSDWFFLIIIVVNLLIIGSIEWLVPMY